MLVNVNGSTLDIDSQEILIATSAQVMNISAKFVSYAGDEVQYVNPNLTTNVVSDPTTDARRDRFLLWKSPHYITEEKRKLISISRQLVEGFYDIQAGLLFTLPLLGNLEQYADNPVAFGLQLENLLAESKYTAVSGFL